jgi:hypothetical protein
MFFAPAPAVAVVTQQEDNVGVWIGSEEATRAMLRMRLFSLVFWLTALSGIAAADGTLQPKYPPSFDCSAVAAGSLRQACNRSHLDPPMGAIPDATQAKPTGIILPQPQMPVVPTGKPPTIPRLPGTIDTGN